MGICCTKPKVETQAQITQPQQVKNQQYKRRDYTKGKLLDRGGSSEVYEGINNKSGKLLAIKTVKLQGDNDKIRRIILNLKSEVKLLKKLQHKNIIKYYFTEVSEDLSSIDVALELIKSGSLRQVLDQVTLEEQTIRIYTKQIMEGVQYLHENKVIHRDIKGANILIDTDGTIKLTDFGTSQILDNNNPSTGIKGTLNWIAPEVFLHQDVSYAADIWSVGGVVLEMITRQPPYYQINSSQQIIQEIAQCKKPQYPQKLNPQIKDFLDRIFVEQSIRPTASELLQHPYLTFDIMLSTQVPSDENRQRQRPSFYNQEDSSQLDDRPINSHYLIAQKLQEEKKIQEKLLKMGRCIKNGSLIEMRFVLVLFNYLKKIKNLFERNMQSQSEVEKIVPESKLCVKCNQFTGLAKNQYHCSKCYKDIEKQEQEQQPAIPLQQTQEQPKLVTDPGRCKTCNRKLGISGIQCKCQYYFCASHRLPENHQCSFDHALKAKQLLVKNNPLVDAEKIQKI
ncbi:hypothetical protein pb186bvf_006634 [Paramecium bursaria]